MFGGLFLKIVKTSFSKQAYIAVIAFLKQVFAVMTLHLALLTYSWNARLLRPQS